MNFVVAWFTDFSNMFLFCCVVNLFKLVFPSLLLSSPVFCFTPSYIHMKGVFAGRFFKNLLWKSIQQSVHANCVHSACRQK